MPVMYAAAIGGAASLLGGFMSNKASAESADKQIAMQDYWLRNRHQIEGQDLRAAGLNPILSAGSNPPVPAGARYEAKDPITPAVSTAMQLKLMGAELEKKRAEADALVQQTNESAERQYGFHLDNRTKAIPHGIELDSTTGDSGVLSQKPRSLAEWKAWTDHQTSRSVSAERHWDSLTAREKMYVALVAAKVAEQYGLSTAKEQLTEIIQRGKSHAATAFLHGQEGRSARVEADISETPGFRFLERGIGAARGASSAFRLRVR